MVVPQDVREARNITFGLFRLSVGLEDPDELIADFNYAFKEAFNDSTVTSTQTQHTHR